MTTFQTNRANLDEVTVELNQTGQSSTQVNLRHTILDDKKDYVFSVDSLQVPLNNCPIFKFEGELFRIERRNVGELVSANNAVLYQFPETDADGDAVLDAEGGVVLFPPDTDRAIFSVGGARKMFDISALVERLNTFARGFELAYTEKGITEDNFRLHGLDYVWAVGNPINNGTIALHKLQILEPRRVPGNGGWAGADINEAGTHSFLKFKLLPDYSLELWGSSHFWNNFVISFSRTGGELLGFSDSLLTVESAPGVLKHVLGQSIVEGQITNKGSIFIDDAEVNALFFRAGAAAPYRWNYGHVDRDLSIYSEHSLAQSADQRLKVVVTAHLPFQSNISIFERLPE